MRYVDLLRDYRENFVFAQCAQYIGRRQKFFTIRTKRWHEKHTRLILQQVQDKRDIRIQSRNTCYHAYFSYWKINIPTPKTIAASAILKTGHDTLPYDSTIKSITPP